MVEAIPAAILKTYALGQSNQFSILALLSIVVSICTISFSTTSMFFDIDLSPERRNSAPYFYGYIPSTSGARFSIFLLMFCLSACHIAIRTLGISLLASAGTTYICAFLGGDMIFYLLLKLARDEFRYWIKLNGMISWVASVLLRIGMKILVDATVFVHGRK